MIKFKQVNVEAIKNSMRMITRSDMSMGFIALNLILTMGLTFKSGPQIIPAPLPNNTTEAAVSLLSSQLTDVQKGLLTLKTEIKKPQKEVNLDAVSKEVNKLSGTVSELVSSNEHKVREIVSKSANEIHQQIGTLSKQVNNINTAPQGDVYLEAKNLPFSVIAIDSVQEEGVVDVGYTNRNVALEAGDVLAGWVVKKVDFIKQSVLFENSRHQFINIKRECNRYGCILR